MSWEDEIIAKLQAVQDIAVRADIQQELTGTQEQTARTNIGVESSFTNISGSEYKITLNY